MDLDNLKNIWKEQEVNTAPDSQKDIISMLGKKSRRPIAQMKRNLFWELIVVVLLYIWVITYFVVDQGGRYWENGLLLFVIGIVFLVYYYYKNRLLKEMECVTCEVRSNLEMQVNTLEKYIKFYFWAGVVITPIAYFASGSIVLFKSAIGFNVPSDLLFFFIGFGIVLSILSYFMNKWYVNKLYGQHVAKLKELLGQMEEE